jgi:hypothetical protein
MSSEAKPTAETGAGQPATPTAGRGGRNRNRGRKQRSSDGTVSKPKTRVPHEGEIPEMNGFVFECAEERQHRASFGRVMEELRGYVRSEYTYPEDLSSLFGDTIAMPILTPPEAPAEGAPRAVQDDYNDDRKVYRQHRDQLRGTSLPNLFNDALRQCTPMMKGRLKALDGYKTASQTTDCVWLFTSIRAIMLEFDATKKVQLSLLDARANFLNCTQQPGDSVEDYVENVRGWAEAIECYGGHIAEYVFRDRDDPDAVPDLDGYHKAKEETLALAIIRNADPARFGSLRNELANSFLLGQDKYPKDSTAAYNLLINYRPPVAPRNQQHARSGQQQQGASKGNQASTSNSATSTAPLR